MYVDYVITNIFINDWIVREEEFFYDDINLKFIDEYDNWDKINRKGSFILGKTSRVLRDIGLDYRNIIMDKSKILKILNAHLEMTDSIIKQIPCIINNPIIVLKSLSKSNINDNRIVVFGNVFDDKNNPVLVVIELRPSENNNNHNKVYKIASAYGKENLNVIQGWLNNKNNILYLDSDKKRTVKWLNGLGLHLPVPFNTFGSSAINIS